MLLAMTRLHRTPSALFPQAFITLAIAATVCMFGAGCQVESSSTNANQDNDQMTSKPVNDWSTDQYAWKNRPILLFANDKNDAILIQQRNLLDARATGLNDRDIVVIEVINSPDDPEASTVTAAGQPVDASPAELRQRYDIPADSDFAVLLIGKDTGVKLRRDRPVTTDELFGLIDAMPMRQSEMQR